MRYVTPKDIERINEIVYQFKSQNQLFFWTDIGKMTGWSANTARKYYDKDWYPQKYYKTETISLSQNKYSCEPGLYMLKNIQIINEETKYLIKVGKSINLNKRITSYVGANPFAICVSTILCPREDLSTKEKEYHMVLQTMGHRCGNTEWFSLPKDKFDYICEHGFSCL